MKRILLALFFGTTLNASAQCETSVTANDTTICLGDSVTLTASGPVPELTTTLLGGNNHRGNMFDIVALNTVTIESFDAHPVGNTSYEIYYKVGGFVGFEGTAAAWTLLGSAPTVIAQPMGTATPIPIPVNITIPAGQTYAFYVTSSNVAVSQNYTDGSTVGTVYASDANIEFLVGSGMEYPFGGGGSVFAQRVWNGIIHYSTTPGTSYLWNTGAITNEITAAPTAQTTYLVDITPSGCPTVTDSVIVYINPEATVDLGLDTSICPGNSIILDAGTGQAAYNWNNGGSTSQTYIGSAGSTNFVEVTNIEGCTKSDTIAIGVLPVPIVDLGLDTAICEGTLLQLDAGNAASTFNWSTAATSQTIDVGAGTYSVTVTNPEGCVDSSQIVLTENPAPIVDLGNDTTFCLYGTTILDAGSGFSGYLWSTGETTQTITADGTVLGAGNHTFSVEVTGTNGCATTESVVVTVDGCAGTNEEKINHMKVYPNPTNSTLNVSLDQILSDGQLSIYSMEGVLVHSEKLSTQNHAIDVVGLANGAYILELKTNDYTEKIKIIKN